MFCLLRDVTNYSASLTGEVQFKWNVDCKVQVLIHRLFCGGCSFGATICLGACLWFPSSVLVAENGFPRSPSPRLFILSQMPSSGLSLSDLVIFWQAYFFLMCSRLCPLWIGLRAALMPWLDRCLVYNSSSATKCLGNTKMCYSSSFGLHVIWDPNFMSVKLPCEGSQVLELVMASAKI